MNDIRQRALEKARQRQTRQASDQASNQAFMSERKRAKEALRLEISQYTGQNVHKIAAKADTEDSSRPLRVCAYTRVSTPDIEQVTSLEFQKKENKEKIEEYAEGSELLKQVTDLALLANGMLKGKALADFIARSEKVVSDAYLK